MAIKSLYIANFKGIDEGKWIPLKPITLFVGANSSGKSSCIHALACMSQTLKLPNNRLAISLDDEYASVHLGRFIEVVHSKSYDDAISLGIEVENAELVVPGTEKRADSRSLRIIRGDLRAVYNFKSTMRTQNTHLQSASLEIDKERFDVRRHGLRYEVTRASTKAKVLFEKGEGFLLSPSMPVGKYSFERFATFQGVDRLQRRIQDELQGTLYLGPFRKEPQRRYATRGASPSEVGAQGEAAVTLLANEIVRQQSRPHIKQVSKWLEWLGLGNSLEVARIGKSDLFGVDVTLEDGVSLPIADLGYGLSQVLPVLAQCSFAPAGSTLLFEQPEIHLHSLSAKSLARVFAETAKRNVTVVAETHSPDLVWALLSQVRSGSVSSADVAIYRASRQDKRTVLEPIEIEGVGEDADIYRSWEHGISIP